MGWIKDRLRLSPGRIALAAILLLAGLAIVVGSGYQASDVEVEFGTTWLVNEEKGELARVSGPSAEVDFILVGIADAGDDLDVQTVGDEVYLLNTTVGSLQRIDARSLRVASQESVPAGDDVSLVVGTAEDQPLVILEGGAGRVRLVDPNHLGTIATATLGVGELSAGVSGEGIVWVNDPATGEAVGLRDGRETERVRIGDDGDELVVGVDESGTASVFNLTARTWTLLPDGGTVDLDGLAESDVRAMAGRWSTPSFTWPGRWTAFASGGGVAADTDVDDAEELGRPFVEDGRVYFSNPTTGALVVVDAESGRVLHAPQVRAGGGWLETSAVDGFGFGVAPGTDEAWVVDPAGESTPLDLSSPDAIRVDRQGRDLTEAPTRRTADEVVEGQEEGATGGVIIRSTPPTTDPPPTDPCEIDPDLCGPGGTDLPPLETCDVGGQARGCSPCAGGGTAASPNQCPRACTYGGTPPAGSQCIPCTGYPGQTGWNDECPAPPTPPPPPPPPPPPTTICPDGTVILVGDDCPVTTTVPPPPTTVPPPPSPSPAGPAGPTPEATVLAFALAAASVLWWQFRRRAASDRAESTSKGPK